MHERSAGVPHLTRLLVEGLGATAESLPSGLPDVLTRAVQASWQRLDATGRRVLQVLAASGAPADPEQLVVVCAQLGLTGAAVEQAVADATAARIAVVSQSRLWFRHPLLPQTLELSVLPAERAAMHAAWAAVVSGTTSRGMDELRRLGALALHLELAGREAEVFEVSLRAADLARDLAARQAECVHLLRAASALDARGAAAQIHPVALLERAARAAADVGDLATAAELSARALAQVDPVHDPRTHARLLMFSAEKDFHLGRTADLPVDAYRRAVELTAPFPDDPVHADALAELAYALGWAGRAHEARPLALQAVAAARRCGDPAVLANAYGARSFIELSDPPVSDRESALAVHYARQCDDPRLFSDAVTERGNYLMSVGRFDEAADLSREAWRRAAALGLETYAGRRAVDVADRLLELGQLREAADAVRVALESIRSPCAPPALAEHLIAHRAPADALDLLERTLEVQVIDPRVGDLMTMWASRAAADLAESARDRRDKDAARAALQRLDRFLEHRARLERGPNEMMTEGPDLTAMAAVSLAERARCAGRPSPDLWEEAAAACREARLGWDEWLAQLRLAELVLVTDRHHTRAAGCCARCTVGVGEGAGQLLERTTTLARLAGIPLEEPTPVGDLAGTDPFVACTPREHEVLDLVVAGRTYHEIADELTISEKTVSVHVSNLLHKTATASRRELAALAVRLRESGFDPTGPDGAGSQH